MRLLNRISLLALFATLAVGNVFITAQRSLIPMSVIGTVIDIELRREKHPGKDDVHLVTWTEPSGASQTIQIDKAIAEQLKSGDQIHKAAWQSTLYIDNRPISLAYSDDLWGMLKAMPACCCTALAVLFWPQLWSLCVKMVSYGRSRAEVRSLVDKYASRD